MKIQQNTIELNPIPVFFPHWRIIVSYKHTRTHANAGTRDVLRVVDLRKPVTSSGANWSGEKPPGTCVM